MQKEVTLMVASLIGMFFVGMLVGTLTTKPQTTPVTLDTAKLKGELMSECFKSQVDVISALASDTKGIKEAIQENTKKLATLDIQQVSGFAEIKNTQLSSVAELKKTLSVVAKKNKNSNSKYEELFPAR